MTIQGTPNEIAEFINVIRLANVTTKESNTTKEITNDKGGFIDAIEIMNRASSSPLTGANTLYFKVT